MCFICTLKGNFYDTLGKTKLADSINIERTLLTVILYISIRITKKEKV